jgi:uncharacterized membrane protein
MEQFLTFAEQWWWTGLIPVLIGVILHFWHRHYQRTHVESQFVVVTGCAIASIMLISYLVTIVAGLFSILGFFLNQFHHR